MQWGLKTVVTIGILACPIALQQGADARLPDATAVQAVETAAAPGNRAVEMEGLFLGRWAAAERDIAALRFHSPWGDTSLLASLRDFGSSSDPWINPEASPKESQAPAGPFNPSAPRLIRPEPKVRVMQLEFNKPALAPLAHSVFCLKYPADCKPSKQIVRGEPVKLTSQRWAELERVNAEVNRSIVPQPNTNGLAAEKWLIAPKSGECHDYAVTKRHELIALGWAERDLLLAEVIVPSGEHHLVLLVRTSDGDFVADNLSHEIRSWYKTPYQWVRVQSASNPMIWSKVSGRPVWVARSSLSSHAQS